MQLSEIKIRNFRTIRHEQVIPLAGGMTLVGPNSSGKTNILRAIQILFTGQENTFSYNREQDLTFGESKSRTSILATFTGVPEGVDKAIYASIDELHKLQGTVRQNDVLTLSLYFNEQNTPVYGFFPNTKRPTDGTKNAQYSRIHKQLVADVLASFCVYYVPSAKNMRQLYEDLLAPFLRRLAAKALEPHVVAVQETLNDVAESLNEQLRLAGLENLKTSFSIPGNSLERLLTNFDFLLEDPSKTPLYDKGMGIQATALLASFMWVTLEHAKQGKNVIWLLEEPESYLHPQLSSACLRLLEALNKNALLVKSTHALNFVPQNPQEVRGVQFVPQKAEGGGAKENAAAGKKKVAPKDGIAVLWQTEVSAFKTYVDATSRLREFLGVRFSDFYNLGVHNVFVEGQTDRETLKWFLELPSTQQQAWPRLRDAHFLDWGGVKHMGGFLRAAYPFIQKERACVSLFDGDPAGDNERRALQHYFGNGDIPFQANRDFVVVRDRYAIEGLFPDQWIIEIHEAHANWFNDFSMDAANNLQPFDVNDKHKQQVLAELKKRGEAAPNDEWQAGLNVVCGAIETALDLQTQRLAK
jgi:ABC-type cobalamin/Fe3+-siderophores transport system ATPase subunit